MRDPALSSEGGDLDQAETKKAPYASELHIVVCGVQQLLPAVVPGHHTCANYIHCLASGAAAPPLHPPLSKLAQSVPRLHQLTILLSKAEADIAFRRVRCGG